MDDIEILSWEDYKLNRGITKETLDDATAYLRYCVKQSELAISQQIKHEIAEKICFFANAVLDSDKQAEREKALERLDDAINEFRISSFRKNTLSYTSGRQNHESLFNITQTSLGMSATKSDVDRLTKEIGQERSHTPKEQIEELFNWVCEVMDKKAYELGFKEGDTVDRFEAPIFFDGQQARYYLRLAHESLQSGDTASGFNLLLEAIPRLMRLQLLAHELEIIVGSKAINNETNRKSKQSSQNIKNKVMPIFERLTSEGHKRTEASKLAAQEARSQHGIDIQANTIIKWLSRDANR